jgi:2'-hydroxyisoflavone reductase
VNILVLGGTRFIGRAFVETALAAGHALTLFNRGLTDPGAFPAVAHFTGDRQAHDDVAQLGGAWDCVVDVSGYRPDQLRPFLDVAESSVRHYVFISTVSVYAEPLPPAAAEDAPLLEVDESVPAGSPHAYGGLKALCESLLRASLGDRLTVVRPTFVIGPHDYTDRFTWWVRRIARGGRMAVPSNLAQHLQVIDARDLAAFVLKVIEGRVMGIYNAVGPEQPMTIATMLDEVQRALGATVHTVPVDGPGGGASDFPLYIGDDDDGALQVSGAAALARGLRLRPLGDSARDVREWDRARGEPRLRAGSSPAEELAVLASVS